MLIDTRSQEMDGGVRASGFGGYDVSCHCKNYSPRGNVRTLNMGDYKSCDSCVHQRGDAQCGLARRTLQ